MNYKDIIVLIGWLLIVLSCILIAGYLVINNIDGWGWFLFIGIFILSGFKYKS